MPIETTKSGVGNGGGTYEEHLEVVGETNRGRNEAGSTPVEA